MYLLVDRQLTAPRRARARSRQVYNYYMNVLLRWMFAVVIVTERSLFPRRLSSVACSNMIGGRRSPRSQLASHASSTCATVHHCHYHLPTYLLYYSYLLNVTTRRNIRSCYIRVHALHGVCNYNALLFLLPTTYSYYLLLSFFVTYNNTCKIWYCHVHITYSVGETNERCQLFVVDERTARRRARRDDADADADGLSLLSAQCAVAMAVPVAALDK